MISDLLAQLGTLEKSDVRPFPYEACRAVQRRDDRYEGLIPDLDSYFSELAGYRSWGRRILTWADEKIETTRRRIEIPFGERFPGYRELQTLPEESNDLRKALDIAERTRTVLLQLLNELQSERAIAAK